LEPESESSAATPRLQVIAVINRIKPKVRIIAVVINVFRLPDILTGENARGRLLKL
jgi:hypothetical protein